LKRWGMRCAVAFGQWNQNSALINTNKLVIGRTVMDADIQINKLPDTEPPWFSMPTEDEYSADLEDGTPYDMGYKVDEE